MSRVKMNGDQPVKDANGIPETIESSDPIMPGDYMLYSVTLNNKGPAVASGMTIKDVLPAGVEFVSAETRLCQDGATNPCAGAVKTDSPFGELSTDWEAMTSGVLNTNLGVGGTETLYVLVKVADGVEGQTITNTATWRLRSEGFQSVEQHVQCFLQGRWHHFGHHLQRQGRNLVQRFACPRQSFRRRDGSSASTLTVTR